jgi:hypothetical protein
MIAAWADLTAGLLVYGAEQLFSLGGDAPHQ